VKISLLGWEGGTKFIIIP